MDVITFPGNLKTASGLSIILHGVISLPDATSYDKPLFSLSTLYVIKRATSEHVVWLGTSMCT